MSNFRNSSEERTEDEVEFIPRKKDRTFIVPKSQVYRHKKGMHILSFCVRRLFMTSLFTPAALPDFAKRKDFCRTFEIFLYRQVLNGPLITAKTMKRKNIVGVVLSGHTVFLVPQIQSARP